MTKAKTEADRIDRESLRKLQFLLAVQQAKSRAIAADRELNERRQAAIRAGCTIDEVAGAIRIVERAS
jgi:hypothetical protein